LCGFIVSRADEVIDERTVKRRGPDFRNTLRVDGFVFTHYLLHITGEATPQPFVSDDIVCVYNGEIYNHAFHKSDGEVLIPLYQKYGVDFPSVLDGEFAIALYDFKKRVAVFSTDPFGTKPLWINNLSAASYESCIGGRRLPPNTTLLVSFDDGPQHVQPVYSFDFNHQDKTSFDDWISAFEQAVRKRAKDGCFIGLSSGYDSGAIACELIKQQVKFKAYSIRGSEDLLVLNERWKGLDHEFFQLTRADYDSAQRFIKEYAEEFSYGSLKEVPFYFDNMTDDWGAVGFSYICRQAQADGRRVFLSGQGADEILCDYSLTPEISTLKGVYPDKLKIWPNFNGGCQRAFLAKEEYVSGAYGIEGRYPYLDTSLVQEFLWLTPELKNSEYKAPLYQYLMRNNYPFKGREKVGFSAGHNLLETANM
jgi:asparagine synthetase B (glutamine-hydrolysing)